MRCHTAAQNNLIHRINYIFVVFFFEGMGEKKRVAHLNEIKFSRPSKMDPHETETEKIGREKNNLS